MNKGCRICLEEGSLKKSSKFVCPCSCSGSLKFVHKKCLKLWLNSRIQDKKLEGKMASEDCEICKSPILFSITKTHINSCKDARKKFNEHRFLFIVQIVFLICLLGFLVFSLVQVNEGKMEPDNKNSTFYITAICLGVVPIIFIILLILFINALFVRERAWVKKVVDRDSFDDRFDEIQK